MGRERELTLLRETLGRVTRERSPQLVTLVGVPGIGKSRLVFELFATVQTGMYGLVYWRHGRSLPYGDGITFWALGEVVKAQSGILESDGPAEAAEKLARAVRSVVPDAAEAGWVERHLRALAGLDAETATGDAERGEAFAAWRRFLEGLAEERPFVVVFEDLHWADDAMLDFVDYLAEWAGDVPLLVLCTARPELLTRRPEWGGGKVNSSTIQLSPLDEDETAALVRALLGRAVIDADAAGASSRARGRQSALRRGVHPDAERAAGRDARTRDGAGPHRSAPRHARARGQRPSLRRGGDRQRLLARGARRRAVEARGAAAPPRAGGVRPPRASELRRRRDRVQLPPRAHARRRLRADPASTAGGQAPSHGRVDRVARTTRGPRRDARAPLGRGARVRTHHGRLDRRLRGAGSVCVPRGRRALASPCTPSAGRRTSTSGRSSSRTTRTPKLLLHYGRALGVAGDERATETLEAAAERAHGGRRQGGCGRSPCVPDGGTAPAGSGRGRVRPHGAGARARARCSAVSGEGPCPRGVLPRPRARRGT